MISKLTCRSSGTGGLYAPHSSLCSVCLSRWLFSRAILLVVFVIDFFILRARTCTKRQLQLQNASAG